VKIKFAIVFFFFFACLANFYATEPAKKISPITELKTPSLEDTYFKTRDDFTSKFEKEKNSVGSDDSQALMELEKQLRTIIGPINIKGFPKIGKINLETLFPELGFGQVDGLRFDSEQESLFVTTEALLKNYLVNHPELPKNLNELAKTSAFYRLVFHSDAAVTYYAEVPVKSAKGQFFAHAFLGVTAQDIGPFIPKEIYVLVSKKNQILLVYTPTTIRISEIPECKREWDKFEEKSSEAFNVYQSSQLKNKKAIDDSIRYEEEGFEAYHRCYGREVKNQEFFIALKRQAQSIVDRLQGE
jgi:hypothetical protein